LIVKYDAINILKILKNFIAKNITSVRIIFFESGISLSFRGGHFIQFDPVHSKHVIIFIAIIN